MLLREIDQEPSIGVSAEDENWMNGPIKYFFLNDKKQDIDNINVIFKFAIEVTARATQIPLRALTHGIAMRLKARGKKLLMILPMSCLKQRWS